MDTPEGSVSASSRLLALRKARRRLGRSRRLRGRIVSAGIDGVMVDLGGVRGFAPRRELELDWLLAGPKPGLRFRGYVTGVGDALVSLSGYGPRQRAAHAERRAKWIAAMTARLEEPSERALVSGLVLATQPEGALVALADGLITGFVPGLALDSRSYIVAGGTFDFRVIGRPEEPDRDIEVLLWPEPPRTGHA